MSANIITAIWIYYPNNSTYCRISDTRPKLYNQQKWVSFYEFL